MESTSTVEWAGPCKLQLEKDRKEFKDDANLKKSKMHRYPPSIQALGDWCTVPKFVAIGPYYHHRDHLQKAEKMKHVAAHYCFQEYQKVINNSDPSVRDLSDAVVSVAAKIDARGLYDKEVMAGICYEDDFLPMMFYDACFLVTYILRKSGNSFNEDDTDLWDFFESSDNDIALDIMLLENQIPLELVGVVMNMCTYQPLEKMKIFTAMWQEDGFLLDRPVPRSGRMSLFANWNQDYYNKAPHLLALLRFYAVGKRRSSSDPKLSRSDLEKLDSKPISAGLIEIADMGIFLSANKTMELQDMGLTRKWIIFAKLSVAPLTLNDARARWLVNMAAFELCTTPDFFDHTAEFEDSAVCSYLMVVSMLMHREEDVHELRTKAILKGVGFNNKKTLDFFTSLHSLRKGRSYVLVMSQITRYRNRSPWIGVYAFLYHNWKYFVAVGSALGAVIGIITTLMKLKGTH